jgi:hypothetical protein
MFEVQAMSITVRAVALLVVVVLFCCTLPADDKTGDTTSKTDKTTDKTDKTPTKADKSKTAIKAKKEKFEYATPPIAGKITKLDDATKNFSVQIDYGQRDPQRVMNNQNHYARRILEISQDRNPQNRQRQLMELQLDMQRRYADEVVKKSQTVDFMADDNMKVRIKDAPTEYDDKGNPKKHTKAELKELKGPDPSLPGYTAEFEQVKVGQLIQVYLPKPKQTKAKAKSDDDDVAPTRPKAVMLLIVADRKSKD